MGTHIEQAFAEGKKRERRSHAISKMFDIVLPVLVGARERCNGKK